MKSLQLAAAMAALCATAFSQDALAQEERTQSAWSVEGNLTLDLMANLEGGLKTGSRVLDNALVQFNYDGAASGLPGVTATVGALYNGNQAVSGDLVGDLQGISNIETGTQALRPYEVWIAKAFGDGGPSLKAGLIDLNGTFDAPGVSALFLNPSHGIVASFAQSGANGPSIFPTLGLAVVGTATLGEGISVRAGFFDPVPGNPDKPERSDVRWRSDDGALGVFEVERATDNARFALGGWTYTNAKAGSVAQDQGGNAGLYGTVEFNPEGPVGIFMRAGTADPDRNDVSSYLGAGVVWTGPIAARKDDQLGLAIAHVNTSKPARAAGLGDSETNIELTWAAPISGGFAVQGDLQYVINPGADAALSNAFVAGLRLSWSFGGT
jgi:porin